MMRNSLPEAPPPDIDAWLRFGARGKADTVIALASGLPVATILDIGAGTGALLEELGDRRFGQHYVACEPARELFDVLVSKSIPGLDAAHRALLADVPASAGPDLAILSHVLEHLLDPAAVLADAIRRAPYVLLEVPLEGTRIGNLRSKLRALVLREPRESNAPGHVLFFTQRDVRRMVTFSGGLVVRERLYFPRDVYAARDSLLHRIVLRLPDSIAARFYYGHFGVLVARRQPPAQWQHGAYYPPIAD